MFESQKKKEKKNPPAAAVILSYRNEQRSSFIDKAIS